MPDNQNPQSPNFTPGVGRLVTDRYDFQGHINGTAFRHNATMIDLFPTLVIGGNTYTDVQDALVAIIANLSPPLPLATATSPGIVQLSASGDVHGVYNIMKVTGLQGYPINTAPPAVGNLLRWNGTSWAPSSAGTFVAGGDLSGTNNNQTVVGITGTGTLPNRIVAAHTDIIQFSSTSTPFINQLAVNSSSDAVNLTIKAQRNTGSGSGGSLLLEGGTASGGLPGGVSLSVGNAGFLFQTVEVVANQRVAAFFPSDTFVGLTSTDMPMNTGNGIIYIGDTTNSGRPVVPSPTGTILWSHGGQLNVMQEDGTSFVVANPGNTPNPIAAPAQNISTPTLTPIPDLSASTGGSYILTAGAQSVGVGGPTIFGFTFPNFTAANFDVTIVGKEVGGIGMIVFETSLGAYYINGGTWIAPNGMPTLTPSFYSDSANTWAQPNWGSAVTNSIYFNAGSHTGLTISWSVLVNITYTTTSS